MASTYGNLIGQLNIIHETVITAWPDAESHLADSGCSPTAYIDIGYHDGVIYRLADGVRITDLPQSLQLFYYPRLNQLFKLAYNNKIYPA